MKVCSHGAQGSCPRRPEIKCPFDRHLRVVILPQLSSHGRWFFNTECPAFILLTHDAPLMTGNSLQRFPFIQKLACFFIGLLPLSSLSSACHRPYVRQLAPGASPSRPAPRAAISRAGRAIPRRNRRFRPGGAASPAEAQPPSTLSLKSSARIELLVARCAAVSPRIGRSACRAPRCAAPWGASPSRFRYRALVVDERLNGQRTRSARLGAHLAALRDSTSAARSRRPRRLSMATIVAGIALSTVLLCFKSQPRTSDSLAQRICISPSSLDLCSFSPPLLLFPTSLQATPRG